MKMIRYMLENPLYAQTMEAPSATKTYHPSRIDR
jgi:hypothetical protein